MGKAEKGYLISVEEIIKIGLETVGPTSPRKRIKMGDTNPLLKVYREGGPELPETENESSRKK